MKIKCSHTKVADITTLVPNPRNPNVHTKRQIDLLAKIMEFQGVRNPIVVSKRSGFIVKGHGRLAAAQVNGWTSFPVDMQDYDNEAQEYADMISDNKIQELSDLNLGDVTDLVSEYMPDIDLETLGFDLGDLGAMVDLVNKGDENSEWADMPDFNPGENELRIILIFNTELERENYAKEKNISVTSKMNNQWTVRV